MKQKKSQEYDSCLGYRVIEALRNYAQHRGLPVHNLQYNSTFHPDSPNDSSEHSITPSLRVSRLKEEKKFKSSVLKELEAIGDLIDLKPLVRQYMESLGRIHCESKQTLGSFVAQAARSQNNGSLAEEGMSMEPHESPEYLTLKTAENVL